MILPYVTMSADSLGRTTTKETWMMDSQQEATFVWNQRVPMYGYVTWREPEPTCPGCDWHVSRAFSFVDDDCKGGILFELWNEHDDKHLGAHTFNLAELLHPEEQEHVILIRDRSEEEFILDVKVGNQKSPG